MIVRLLSLSLLTTGCAAVLDLDAQPGRDGGAGGSGGSPTNVSTGSSAAGSEVASSGAQSSSGTGEAPCTDDAGIFSGAQLLVVDNPMHNALDFDDKVAIGAWVRPDPNSGNAPYEGYILSRLSDAQEKGYALLVRRSGMDGLLHPEFRFYSGGSLFSCTGQAPLEEGVWSHVAGLYSQGHVQGTDAGLWVNGQQACAVECGGSKLSKFPASPVVGAALSGASGFFRGALDDVFVQTSGVMPPPALDGGACPNGVVFFVTFSMPPAQTFAPDCGGGGLSLTLGHDASPGADDPSRGCP
jgi:hypothetical protein